MVVENATLDRPRQFSELLLGDCGLGRRVWNGTTEGRLFGWRKIWERQLVLIPPLLHLFFGGGGFLLVETGIAGQVEGLGWEGKSGSGPVDDFHNAQQQVFADGIELVGISREHVTKDLES